jgi:creatinine amidohydrolase
MFDRWSVDLGSNARLFVAGTPRSDMELTEGNWADAADSGADVAVLPVGSTEQHGPHAPLGTDTLAARAVAHEGSARADLETVVGPALPVGVAAEHRAFSGTLWVSEDTFRAYVAETIESLAHHGWQRVVVVNGHGGNVPALREVCGRLTRDSDCYAVPFTWFDAVDPADVGFDGAMGHGGPVETSLIQHLRPELVDEDRFERAAEGAAERWGEHHAGVNLAYDTDEFSESGIVGDPRAGSARLGERLLEAAGGELAALLERVETRGR